MKVGFLHSLLRKEEKFLIEEFTKHKDVELITIDDRQLVFNLNNNVFELDVLIERSIINTPFSEIKLFSKINLKAS